MCSDCLLPTFPHGSARSQPSTLLSPRRITAHRVRLLIANKIGAVHVPFKASDLIQFIEAQGFCFSLYSAILAAPLVSNAHNMFKTKDVGAKFDCIVHSPHYSRLTTLVQGAS